MGGKKQLSNNKRCKSCRYYDKETTYVDGTHGCKLHNISGTDDDGACSEWKPIEKPKRVENRFELLILE